jgi:signal transduction histidine kinase/sensor domain CHASE-containing protein
MMLRGRMMPADYPSAVGGAGWRQRALGRIDPRAAVWSCVVLGLLLVSWWFATEAYRADRIRVRREAVAAQAKLYAETLSHAVDARASLTRGLAAFVIEREGSGGLTQKDFDTFAAGEYALAHGIRTVQVAPDAVIRWTYPLEGNRQAIGLDLRQHQVFEVREDTVRAIETRKITVSGPFQLAQGGIGLVIRQAVVIDGRVWGIAAVVTDVPLLLAEAGLAAPPSDLRVAVRDNRGRVFSGDASTFRSDPVIVAAVMPEGSWRVAALPRDGWSAAVSGTVTATRLMSLAIVLLLTLVTYLVVSRQRRLVRAVADRTRELGDSESRYRALFEMSPVALREQDFSQVRRRLEELSAQGVTDIRAHLGDAPGLLEELIGLIRVNRVNSAMPPLYGAASEEVFLTGLSAYFSAYTAPIFLEQMVAVAESRTRFRGETTLRTPTGQTRYVVVDWAVMPGHEADYGSVIVSIVDLTDRVEAEKALQAIRENLENLVEERTRELSRVNDALSEAQQAKNVFVASMSHELRTPLNSILGFSGVLLQGAPGPLTDEQDRQLQMIRRSGRQLLALVNDILDLSKVEQGKIQVHIEEFDLVSLADSVTASLRPLAEEKHLKMTLIAPEHAVPIVSDPQCVRQILNNLLGNAVKFTGAGLVEATIHKHGKTVFLAVRDTGIGIPENELEAIFQPFYQIAPYPSAEAPGTGLGLSLSRDLAVHLGGSLTAESTLGAGSVFTLRLPTKPPDAVA